MDDGKDVEPRLQGTELEFSWLAIEFRKDTAKTTYCQVSSRCTI